MSSTQNKHGEEKEQNMASNTILTRDQNITASTNACNEDVLFDASPSNMEEIEMTFASDGIDFILDLLTDLSVNRGAYALREAYSNAYDATMAAGDMSLPIEIELPHVTDSEGEPDNIAAALGYIVLAGEYAVIRDHGCGMTEQDIRLYFTQYGGSKKRVENNVDSIGSKGLGSKAPLAVSDTFTVRSIKDGIATTAILERRGSRNYASIMTEETDEPNGTEVRIPVSDASVAKQMEECAREIAAYNLDANLIVNGEKTRNILDTNENADNQYVALGSVEVGCDEDGNPVSFRVWQLKKEFPKKMTKHSSIDLNLAGVRYRLNDGWGNADFIVAGDPGYLNFTPSRDEIKQDAAREKFLAAVIEGVSTHDYSDALQSFLATEYSSIAERIDWLRSVYHRFERKDGKISFMGARFGSGAAECTIDDGEMFSANGKSVFSMLENDSKEFFVLYHNVYDRAVMTASEKDMSYLSKPELEYVQNDNLKPAGMYDLYKIRKSDIANANPITGCGKADRQTVSKISAAAVVSLRSAFYYFGNAHIMFIEGIDCAEKMSRLASSEHALYESSEYGKIVYAISDKKDVFTDDEKDMLGALVESVEFIDYEQMLAIARDYRQAQKKENSNKPSSVSTPSMPDSIAEVIDLDEIIANGYAYSCFGTNRVREKIDFADADSLSDFVIAFGDRNYDNIVKIAALMHAAGDFKESKLLLIRDLYATDVRKVVKAYPEKVFCDLRDVKILYEGMLERSEDVDASQQVSAALLERAFANASENTRKSVTAILTYKTKVPANLWMHSFSEFVFLEAFAHCACGSMFVDNDIRYALDFLEDVEQRRDGRFGTDVFGLYGIVNNDIPDFAKKDVEHILAAVEKTESIVNESGVFQGFNMDNREMFCKIALPGIAAVLNEQCTEELAKAA